MKSKLLNTLWHHTLPNLGINAQYQKTIRSLLYPLLHLERDPFTHVLEQIRMIIEHSPRILSDMKGDSHSTGDPVIIWSMRGGLQVNVTEAILAHSLQLRGVPVRIVLCDEFLSACEQRAMHLYPKDHINQRKDRQICDRCHFIAVQVFNAFKLPVVFLSHLISQQEIAIIQERVNQMSSEEILLLEDNKVFLGGEVRAFLNIFYRALTWPNSSQTDELLQRAALSALILRLVSDRIIDKEKPRAVLTSHGIYLLWGIISRVAQQRGIPLTVWGNGYRTGTLRFSLGNWFEASISEPLSQWEGLELTPHRTQILDEYLGNRWDGHRDRRKFFDNGENTKLLSIDQLGLDPQKPTLGVFPNIVWDADLNFKDIVFKNMLEWVVETVRWFISHPKFQVVVRAHPGESIAVSNESVFDLIMGEFPTLPSNVVVIHATSKVNSYELAHQLHAATVYGSQFGLELACRGVPVIVASECFYRGKGFTFDVKNQKEYFIMLEQLNTINSLADNLTQRARTYAYHCYFRRLIPFPYLISDGWSNLKNITLQSLDDLLPQQSQYLDLIVQGILDNKPIVNNV